MTKRYGVYVAALVAGGVVALPAAAVNFTIGNLVLTQVGPGNGTTGGLTAPATALRLREFGLATATSGAFVNNDVLFASGASSPTRLTVSGSAGEGFLTRSADGRYLTVAGYDAANGQPGPLGGVQSIATSTNHSAATGPAVNRVVGRIDVSQNVVYNRMTDAYNTANIRAAATSDGSTFYVAGTGGSANPANTGGVRFLDPVAGTTSTQVATTFASARVVNYALNNRVFVSGQSGTAGVTGIHEVVAGVATILPGFGDTTLSPYDFWFADSDTLYVADDGSIAAASKGGLQRWELSGGTWTLAYRVTTGLTSGLRSVCGTTDANGNYVLYATTNETATRLVAFTDSANAALNGATATTTALDTAGAGFAFRGVRFAPIPAPGSAVLLGLGGLIATRRRR